MVLSVHEQPGAYTDSAIKAVSRPMPTNLIIREFPLFIQFDDKFELVLPTVNFENSADLFDGNKKIRQIASLSVNVLTRKYYYECCVQLCGLDTKKHACPKSEMGNFSCSFGHFFQQKSGKKISNLILNFINIVSTHLTFIRLVKQLVFQFLSTYILGCAQG